MSCNTTLTLRTDPIEEHLDDIGTTFFSAPSYSVQPTHLRDDMFLQLIIICAQKCKTTEYSTFCMERTVLQ